MITLGLIQSQHLCLSPFLSRKARTIRELPFALVVIVAVDLVVAVAAVAVVGVPRICQTHRNTVTGRRPFFKSFPDDGQESM